MPSSPIVVVLQLAKLKKYFGAMGVSNPFYGTKLILEGDMPTIAEYRNKCRGCSVTGFKPSNRDSFCSFI